MGRKKSNKLRNNSAGGPRERCATQELPAGPLAGPLRLWGAQVRAATRRRRRRRKPLGPARRPPPEQLPPRAGPSGSGPSGGREMRSAAPARRRASQVTVGWARGSQLAGAICMWPSGSLWTAGTEVASRDRLATPSELLMIAQPDNRLLQRLEPADSSPARGPVRNPPDLPPGSPPREAPPFCARLPEAANRPVDPIRVEPTSPAGAADRKQATCSSRTCRDPIDSNSWLLVSNKQQTRRKWLRS